MVEWKWMCLRDFSIADVCVFQPINEMLIGSTFQIYRHKKLNRHNFPKKTHVVRKIEIDTAILLNLWIYK